MEEEQIMSSPIDDPVEMAHFKQVVDTFFNYSVRYGGIHLACLV
jgi:hypothetical protein